MKSDFLVALTQLAAERGLPQEKVMSAIEAALISAYKKDSVNEGHNISVRLDPGSGDIEVDIVKTVVDEVEDPLTEISLTDAKSQFNPNASVGDNIKTESIPNSAGRIAAQTAKQVVLQRLKEAEKELVLAEYQGREGEMITVTILRIEPGKIIVDTGRAEALLPASQQVSTERYRTGAKIKVLLKEIDKDSTKGPELIVSRNDDLLLQRLFEQEVPEIFNGSVEIVTVARESGARSKVAVRSKQQGIDPVGSCVGLRGVRIQSIVNELHGEKIDILEWDKDINKFIQNALSPSQVLRVKIESETGKATAIVPDRHLSLAIGKEGQNARLAAKLCGWAVDIKSDKDVNLDNFPEHHVIPNSISTALQIEPKNTEVALDTKSKNTNPEAGISPEEKSSDSDNEEKELSAMIATEELETTSETEEALTPEEELILLEENHEQNEEESAGTKFSALPEDIWSIHRAGSNQDSSNTGTIRFAEDIEDLRGGITSRKGKNNSANPVKNNRKTTTNNRNKKRR
jgi:N utilization substance protein A